MNSALTTIHLQGIGQFPAKPAKELKTGDTTVWNNGSQAEIVSVRDSGKSVYVVLRTKDGKEWPERRFLKTRLVACTRISGHYYYSEDHR